jgi:hypothetical protein
MGRGFAARTSELPFGWHVGEELFGGSSMTHSAAVRASILFVILTILSGAVGLGSHAAVAEAVFVISASVFALTLVFALATPVHRAVPVRVRKTRAHF